jgi:hypothetical protein
MTRLTDALQALGLGGQVVLSGRWVTLEGERGRVYVAEARRDGGFYTWCDIPTARAVEHYPDATTAIVAGLRRAAAPDAGKADSGQTYAEDRLSPGESAEGSDS